MIALKNLQLLSSKKPQLLGEKHNVNSKIGGPSFRFSVPVRRSFPGKVYCRTTEADHAPKRLPPGPMKLPIIGNLHNLGGALPHRALRKLAMEHGPLMHLQLGEVSAVVVTSPRMAQEVMKTQDHNFADRPEILLTKILLYDSTNVAFSNGEYWKQMRKVCVNELLGAKRVRSFSNIRIDEVWNLVESIRSLAGSPFNFSEKVMLMTNTIVARAAFGSKNKDQDKVLALAKQGAQLAGGFGLGDVFPSIEFLHVISGMKPALEKMHVELDKVLSNIINDHKEKLRRPGDGSLGESEEEEDLVDILLQVQESGSLECPITTSNVKAVIWDMFSAGTDTSSSTLEWAMSEMMKKPSVLVKAQAEIRRVFKGKSSIEEADIQELKYLKCVIKETLRLHPPAPLLLPRESKEDTVIDGYQIPAKTKVIVNAWAIGRDPHYWYDSESFIPERFEKNSVDFKGFNFEFIPFGSGRRTCPGMTFALANIEYPLSQLLYHFNWRLPDGTTSENLDMTECFGVTVARKNHLHLVATPYISTEHNGSQQNK